jgi:hypothetical protein
VDWKAAVRQKSRLIIVLLLLALGFVVLAVLYNRATLPPAEAVEEPPCGSTARNKLDPGKCDQYAALPGSNIPSVTLCDLVSSPEKYTRETVRVKATFVSDSGSHSLHERACPGGDAWAVVDFDSSYGIRPEAQRNVDQLLCDRSRYYANKQADVVVVGRFDGWVGEGHQKRMQFIVMCFEEAKRTESPNPNIDTGSNVLPSTSNGGSDKPH